MSYSGLVLVTASLWIGMGVLAFVLAQRKWNRLSARRALAKIGDLI